MINVKTNLQAMIVACLGAGLLCLPAMAQSTQNLPIRGVVRAVNTAAISTDLQVPIQRLYYKKGESFKSGDTLVKFDCARFAAEKNTLQAERKVQYLTYKNNQTLLKHRAIGEFDVEISKAKVGKADAEIRRLDVRLSTCTVKAPFDGRIRDTPVLQYETPKPGAPFIEIIDTGDMAIDFIVPSNWLAWMKIGTKFSFRIDETKKTYDGQVSRLGASVDPVSQTIEIRGAFAGKPKGVFVGMSGSARFFGPGS